MTANPSKKVVAERFWHNSCYLLLEKKQNKTKPKTKQKNTPKNQNKQTKHNQQDFFIVIQKYITAYYMRAYFANCFNFYV